MADKIYLRGGLAAARPTLAEREPGFDTDTKEFYIGSSGGNEQIYAPYNTKSALRAFQSSIQSISASVFTKVIFQTEEFDNQSEYNISLSRFVAAKAGNYLVSSGVTIGVPTIGTDIAIGLYKNGGLFAILQESRIGSAGNITVAGSSVIKLAATDYLEIFAFLSGAFSTASGSNFTYFCVNKL